MNHSKKHYVQKSLYMSRDVVDRVIKKAEADNRSFTNMVETMLMKQLNYDESHKRGAVQQ